MYWHTSACIVEKKQKLHKQRFTISFRNGLMVCINRHFRNCGERSVIKICKKSSKIIVTMVTLKDSLHFKWKFSLKVF